MRPEKAVTKCQASTCPRYTSFSVYSHTIAIAFKLNIFPSYIKKADRRNPNQALTNAVNFRKQKDAGKKKSQSTSKRKGLANSKSEKVIKLVDLDNENISFSNSNVGSVISGIATLKPSYPNTLPNQYVLGILQFCCKQLSVCYGCGCKFYIDGYPEPPSDLVIVSSKRRSCIDSNYQRAVSPQFSKVYSHFSYSCITVHNQFFAPLLIIIPKDLNLYLSPVHKEVLMSNSNLKHSASLNFSSFYTYICYRYIQVGNIQCSSASKYIQNEKCCYCESKIFYVLFYFMDIMC